MLWSLVVPVLKATYVARFSLVKERKNPRSCVHPAISSPQWKAYDLLTVSRRYDQWVTRIRGVKGCQFGDRPLKASAGTIQFYRLLSGSCQCFFRIIRSRPAGHAARRIFEPFHSQKLRIVPARFADCIVQSARLLCARFSTIPRHPAEDRRVYTKSRRETHANEIVERSVSFNCTSGGGRPATWIQPRFARETCSLTEYGTRVRIGSQQSEAARSTDPGELNQNDFHTFVYWWKTATWTLRLKNLFSCRRNFYPLLTNTFSGFTDCKYRICSLFRRWASWTSWNSRERERESLQVIARWNPLDNVRNDSKVGSIKH